MSEFYFEKSQNSRNQRTRYCKSCASIAHAEWQDKNRAQRNAYLREWRKSKAHLTHSSEASVEIKSFPNGLTIKELKEIIADWVEVDDDGEPTKVWIETGWCLSSIVVDLCPLNKTEKSSDLILSSGAFETPTTNAKRS